jgi:molecular chaperone DnaK (HSP70)
MVAGIDFGTANTSVALFDGKKTQALPDPYGTLRYPVTSSCSPELRFRLIQELVKRQCGSRADSAVIALSEGTGGTFARRITEAGKKAGFQHILLIHRAEAVAIAVNKGRSGKIIVLDFEKGRFAASLLDIRDTFVELERGLSNRSSGVIRLTRIEELIRQLLRASGYRGSEINTVLLTGGGLHVPSIRKCVANIFPESVYIKVCPSEEAALGALILSQIKTAPVQSSAAVSAADIGLEIDWGRSFWMLKKNSPLPASEQRIFTTLAENQRQVEIHVIQRSTEDPTRVISLSRIRLPETLPSSHGRPKIYIQFMLQPNGLLTVRVQSSTGSISETMRISACHSSREYQGYSKNDIDMLISRVEREYRGRRFFIDPELSEDIDAILELARREKKSADPGLKRECSIALWSVLKEIKSMDAGREADCAG